MADERPLGLEVLRAVGRFVVTLVLIGWTILDALLFPLLRPIINELARLRLFESIGSALGRLPPYVALLTLAVPFLVIEPFKWFALYWFGIGHYIQGALLLVLAHGGSILIVERLYHAMHVPLMRIGWFRRLMSWLDGLRRAALDWARSTDLWRSAAGLAQTVRAAVRGWVRALRRG
ncbi:MAG: hypothetical protein ACTHOR_14170 [Devosia sp.]